MTTLSCQPLRRAAVRSSHDDAPQPSCRIGAHGEVCVERDDGCDRRARPSTMNEQHGRSAVMLVDKPIFAVSRAALKQRRNRAEVARISERPWRWGNDNGARIEFGQPNDRRSIRSQIRIDRETEAPSAKSTAPENGPDRQRRDRLGLALRALDARLSGESYRVIAQSLFRPARIPAGAAWKTHELRDRTIRLARVGLKLMRGGYLELLRYPRKQPE